MNHWVRSRFGGMILCALTLFAFGAKPALSQITGPPGQPVSLDFQDLDLAYVLSALAQAAGLNFVYHDLPAKPVTLRTTVPIPREQLPDLIRSLAAANGVTVALTDGFLRMVGGGEDPDPRRLYIHRLRHQRAATLASTLGALFGTGGAGAQQAGLRPTLSQQLQQFQNATPAAVAQQVPGGIVITGGGGQGGLQGNVLMVPEEVTNSLLIRATPADWAIIEQALFALDLRPLQVVIEVVIAEVRRNEDLDLGTSWTVIKDTSGGTVVADLPPSATIPEGAFAVQVARIGDVDITATLEALAATGDVRILQRPIVLAQNNQPARILVGSEQPFIQVTQASAIDPTATIQTVQYREVGTVLNILPTINEDGYVNLAVTQEVSNATAATQFGAPIISTREAETQLLARNGQTVVMGGLVDQQSDKVRSGIPFLKDIPILGYLFGSVRERAGSSELFLFLTPYIVATDDDADRLRERIETEREMLAPYLPFVPIAPPPITPPGAPAPTPPPPPPPPPPGGGERD